MNATVLQFPLDRWQETKARSIRVYECVRPIKRGAGIGCEHEGCTRKARRQVIRTGQSYCEPHTREPLEVLNGDH
jgi:hypothetical protein